MKKILNVVNAMTNPAQEEYMVICSEEALGEVYWHISSCNSLVADKSDSDFSCGGNLLSLSNIHRVGFLMKNRKIARLPFVVRGAKLGPFPCRSGNPGDA